MNRKEIEQRMRALARTKSLVKEGKNPAKSVSRKEITDAMDEALVCMQKCIDLLSGDSGVTIMPAQVEEAKNKVKEHLMAHATLKESDREYTKGLLDAAQIFLDLLEVKEDSNSEEVCF